VKGRVSVVVDLVALVTAMRPAFEAAKELFKFLQTKQGQELIAQSLKDREEWDRFWSEAGGGLAKFFSGKLFSG